MAKKIPSKTAMSLLLLFAVVASTSPVSTQVDEEDEPVCIECYREGYEDGFTDGFRSGAEYMESTDDEAEEDEVPWFEDPEEEDELEESRWFEDYNITENDSENSTPPRWFNEHNQTEQGQ